MVYLLSNIQFFNSGYLLSQLIHTVSLSHKDGAPAGGTATRARGPHVNDPVAT